MRWTKEMKRRAAKAIQTIGGADKATPKKLLLALAVPGLTMLQVSLNESRADSSHCNISADEKEVELEMVHKKGCIA